MARVHKNHSALAFADDFYITITSFMGAFKVYSSVIGIFGTGRYGPVGNDKLLITIVGYVYDQFDVSGMPFGVGSADRWCCWNHLAHHPHSDAGEQEMGALLGGTLWKEHYI